MTNTSTCPTGPICWFLWERYLSFYFFAEVMPLVKIQFHTHPTLSLGTICRKMANSSISPTGFINWFYRGHPTFYFFRMVQIWGILLMWSNSIFNPLTILLVLSSTINPLIYPCVFDPDCRSSVNQSCQSMSGFGFQ